MKFCYASFVHVRRVCTAPAFLFGFLSFQDFNHHQSFCIIHCHHIEQVAVRILRDISVSLVYFAVIFYQCRE